MMKTGNLLGDHYRIVRTLGQGGMGAVYLAETTTGEEVAVKEMVIDIREPGERQKAIEQFAREAAILGQLKHRSLVEVRDFFQEGDRHYMVMDYVDGENLAERLDRGDRPSLQEVRQWAGQLCDVLHYMHSRDPMIIFRDLKPSNIMVDRSGEIRLIDFGIARVFEQDTKTHTFIKGVGSKGFAPIEQYGAGATDARTDIYALGATLYNLLTGEKPPAAVGILAGTDHLHLPRALNPEIPKRLELVLLKMMALQKDNRFASVEEVRQALESAYTEDDDPDSTDALTGMLLSSVLLPAAETAPSPALPRGLTTRLLVQVRRRATPRNVLALVLVLIICLSLYVQPSADPGPAARLSIGPGSGEQALEDALRQKRSVFLQPGEYTLNSMITLDADIEIFGSGREKTRIVSHASSRGLDYRGGGTLVVSDLALVFQGDKTSNLVFVSGGRARFSRCSFSGARRNDDARGGAGQHGTGLRIGGKTLATVQECVAFDNMKFGIQVCDQARVDIIKARSEKNQWGGIGFLDASTGSLGQSEIRENRVGVMVNGNAAPMLQANLIEANTEDGIVFQDFAAGRAESNRCLKNGKFGIELTGRAQPIVSRNTLKENRSGDAVGDSRS
ncbi:MAG: protein kinase [Armatimonadetes bacterium]|nr:protein kinase [Armatimonadota bacterium]